LLTVAASSLGEQLLNKGYVKERDMNRSVHSRRDFLGGLLAAGAAVLLPNLAQARVLKRVQGSVIINGGK